jgi:hypothetical protein
MKLLGEVYLPVTRSTCLAPKLTPAPDSSVESLVTKTRRNRRLRCRRELTFARAGKAHASPLAGISCI